MIISREYIGTQTVAEAFVPIISEDIRKKIAEGDWGYITEKCKECLNIVNATL